MKLELKEYSNPTKETIVHGVVEIDFDKGVSVLKHIFKTG